MSSSTDIVITIRTLTTDPNFSDTQLGAAVRTNPGFSDTQLGAAVRAMYANKTVNKIAKKKKTATKPDLKSMDQFLEKFPNRDVPATVVGKFFNIKGLALAQFGLERYNPVEGKPRQNIRVILSEGGGAGYVPPGGVEVRIAPATPTTSTTSTTPGDPPRMPMPRRSQSCTNGCVADPVARKLPFVPEGRTWGR